MKIDPESWPALSKLLDEWLELPVESRAGWLDSLGPEHADILPMLRQIAQAQTNIDTDFLNTLPRMGTWPRSAVAASESSVAGAAVGALIGPYRLLAELGQGGMGVVWLAEHADGHIKRRVALKLPIIPLHNSAVAERFTRERDILARLTHPHIARLYDAGVTDTGQPYLALEYVEGQPIIAYCDQRRLRLNARLRLFLQVLRAVQYAHTNLIVHRDLKPANILVTRNEEVR